MRSDSQRPPRRACAGHAPPRFGGRCAPAPVHCPAGLAPHYDDVDVWVVQTEGSKAWRVHAPPPSGWLSQSALASSPSPDLEESELGPLALEVTLEVGLAQRYLG